jgi:hypothetical protein
MSMITNQYDARESLQLLVSLVSEDANSAGILE